jgi:D-sedoheptulose 7-phosphate isomerase/D-glycero-D-manno-heptose 1,7-bisphosphate phosphatase
MIKEYKKMIDEALDATDEVAVDGALRELLWAATYRKPVLVFGNGGSAAIAEHFSCDHTKGVWHDTNLKSCVHSLSSNLPLITAIANDYSYEDVFSKQIEYCSAPAAVVVAISSSGNSPNIIQALKTAEAKGYVTIAMVGFDGGVVVRENLAWKTIHVPSNNYGVVEDCHQIIMHMMAQKIRTENAVHPGKLKL